MTNDTGGLYLRLAEILREVVEHEVREAALGGGEGSAAATTDDGGALDFDADSFEDTSNDSSFGSSLDDELGVDEEAYTPYTRDELLGLGKNDLLKVADSWGLSKSGEAEEVIDRIMAAQDVSVASGPDDTAESFDDDETLDDSPASADQAVDWSEDETWDWGDDSEDSEDSDDDMTLDDSGGEDSGDLSLDDFLK